MPTMPTPMSRTNTAFPPKQHTTLSPTIQPPETRTSQRKLGTLNRTITKPATKRPIDERLRQLHLRFHEMTWTIKMPALNEETLSEYFHAFRHPGDDADGIVASIEAVLRAMFFSAFGIAVIVITGIFFFFFTNFVSRLPGALEESAARNTLGNQPNGPNNQTHENTYMEEHVEGLVTGAAEARNTAGSEGFIDNSGLETADEMVYADAHSGSDGGYEDLAYMLLPGSDTDYFDVDQLAGCAADDHESS